MRRNGAEDVLECRSREGSLPSSVGMHFTLEGRDGWRRRRETERKRERERMREKEGKREGERERERGYSCRAITVAEVQTSREFERRPVAVRASTTTRREVRSCTGLERKSLEACFCIANSRYISL